MDPTAETHRRIVSIQDAAKYAGVNPKTIRRRIDDGTFKGYRFGPRLLRVDLAEIDAYISAHEKPAADGQPAPTPDANS